MNEYWLSYARFWSFEDPASLWVVLGSVTLGVLAAILGSFSFLRKQSLLGDALAHAALPGVTTAFLLLESRDPLVILLGASASCAVGMAVIQILTNYTKIKQDSALAIVLSTFFAVGIFQLTYIQKSGSGSQAGLDKLLFGQAASLIRSDVELLALVALGVLLIIGLTYERLKLVCFDRELAAAQGINVAGYDLLLGGLFVLSISIGLQLVGVVLMAALLLTPPAAARYWSESLGKLLGVAAIFGAISGILGASISAVAPRMPTGPWIVVVVSSLFFISLFLAPERGVLARYLRYRNAARRTREENVLRTLFKLVEGGSLQKPIEPLQVMKFRSFKLRELEQVINVLAKKGYVAWIGKKVQLTLSGVKEAQRLTRIHRLWELYLSEKINIAADHVHADAEEIEHFITPDLEARLMEELGHPKIDPHGRSIPNNIGKLEQAKALEKDYGE